MGNKNLNRDTEIGALPDDADVDFVNTLSKSTKRTFLANGTKIGKYEIIEEIDRGGMAVVYKAKQTDLDRIVALKVLPANITLNDTFVDRFFSEAHAVAKLKHGNIVNIYEVAVENGIHFIAMDYIDGKNLFYYLNDFKPKLVEVLEIIRILALSLQYAHDKKIMHRDLKLNNVIMRENKEPILIDFGLAKVLEGDDTNHTKTGEIAGSPSYMAPERINGTASDERSDICSLGIMLYEMLTFKNPYLDPRSIVQTAKNVVEATPVRPRNLIQWLPIEVESITLKAMACDPSDRYQNMLAFANDIKRYQDGDRVLASPPSIIKSSWRFIRKNWAPFVIGTIIFIFTLLLILLVNYQTSKEKSGWKLAYAENFNDVSALKDWTVFKKNRKLTGNGNWNILDSSLYIESDGYTYIRLNRSFTRDVKVEFDIRAGVKDIFNTGIFLYGKSPLCAYTAHIHKGGEVLNGFTLPESDFLFYDYKQVEFPIDSLYHVVVERKGSQFKYTLNGIIVSTINQIEPAFGKNHNKLGFYVNGSSIMIDNFKIYRRGVPRLARPTMVADRFWQQGNFNDALDEYKEILFDIPSGKLSTIVKFRMVDCLLRLNMIDKAEQILSDISNIKKLTDAEKASLLYWSGRMNQSKGMDYKLPSSFFKLSKLYPNSKENRAVAINQIIKLCQYSLSDSNNIIINNIINYVNYYPLESIQFGRLILKIQQKMMWENKKEAIKLGKNIYNLFSNDQNISIRAMINNAKIYLSMRSTDQAIELLTKAVSTQANSVAKWEAWILLADIYEMKNRIDDALIIYTKVYSEAPKTLPESWIAKIRMNEFLVRNDGKKMQEKFVALVDNQYQLMEPRLIAQFYSNMISWKYFRNQWQLLYPSDSAYKYYLVRKRLMQDSSKYTGFSKDFYKQPTIDETWNDIRLNNIVNKVNYN